MSAKSDASRYIDCFLSNIFQEYDALCVTDTFSRTHLYDVYCVIVHEGVNKSVNCTTFCSEINAL